jgi:hypothetical protein
MQEGHAAHELGDSMNDADSLLARLDRSARSIARWSTATKLLSGVMLVIALFMLLYAFSRADRRVDDFVGFGLLSLGIAAVALLFGSSAAFHTAFGDAVRLATTVHLDVERLVRLQEHQIRKADAVATPPSAEAPPPAYPAQPAAGERPQLTGSSAAPALGPPSVAKEGGNRALEAGAAKVEPPAPKSPAEPAMKTCPACRTVIRADATRCRGCFARV